LLSTDAREQPANDHHDCVTRLAGAHVVTPSLLFAAALALNTALPVPVAARGNRPFIYRRWCARSSCSLPRGAISPQGHLAISPSSRDRSRSRRRRSSYRLRSWSRRRRSSQRELYSTRGVRPRLPHRARVLHTFPRGGGHRPGSQRHPSLPVATPRTPHAARTHSTARTGFRSWSTARMPPPLPPSPRRRKVHLRR